MTQVTKQQVKNFLLHKANLNSERNYMQVLNDLSCIQVDPINVVARSHELSFYNRARDFVKQDLYKALYEEHSLFEYWMQVYSIIPLSAYPYLHSLNQIPGDSSTSLKLRRNEISNHWHTDYRKLHQKEIDLVLKFITENGPTSSKEISHLPKGSAVHSWKGVASQIALLEFLWNTGELQICYRKSNTKYYDLSERVLPTETSELRVSELESLRYLFDANLKYHGISRSSRLNRAGRNRAKPLRDELQRQIKSGEVLEIKIEGGLSGVSKYFMKQSDFELLQTLKDNPHVGLNILAPLDPLIIDRELTRDAFDFFYRWEAYTPAAKRQFGFYNMPILFNGEIVGQVDVAKSKAGDQRLEIRGLFLNKKSKELTNSLDSELESLEKFALS